MRPALMVKVVKAPLRRYVLRRLDEAGGVGFTHDSGRPSRRHAGRLGGRGQEVK